MMRIAIDTGGTFTDCVYLRDGVLVVLKVFSAPDDPGQAVLNALGCIAPQHEINDEIVVRHGTTVGTNAMLERKGARVAFVTTAGFEDTIAIGRQARAKLYDWFQPAPMCLVPEELRFGITERVGPDGVVLQAISEDELKNLVEAIGSSGAESIAVSLLFGFANPRHEAKLAEALASLGLPLSTSHKILPEFREYERASTVVANAYLAPKMSRYLNGLGEGLATRYSHARLEVMQSSGGIIPGKLAAEEPVRTVLSGPAGGVIGAHKLATLAGFNRILGFDMGGTSTDVCLVDGTQGGMHITSESMIAGVPLSVPMHTHHGRWRRLHRAFRCGRHAARRAGVGRLKARADLLRCRRAAHRNRCKPCVGTARSATLCGRQGASACGTHTGVDAEEQGPTRYGGRVCCGHRAGGGSVDDEGHARDLRGARP